jgi:hypothetical protein
MKLLELLTEEVSFRTYEAMVQVTYADINQNDLAEVLRALPGVTTCTNAGGAGNGTQSSFKIKVVSQKEASEAFEALKTNVLEKYPFVSVFEVGPETIEEK